MDIKTIRKKGKKFMATPRQTKKKLHRNKEKEGKKWMEKERETMKKVHRKTM